MVYSHVYCNKACYFWVDDKLFWSRQNNGVGPGLGQNIMGHYNLRFRVPKSLPSTAEIDVHQDAIPSLAIEL